MFMHTVKYEDFNGVQKERDIYFNMSEPEMTFWETSESGGLSNIIDRITKTKDTPMIMKYFEEIIDRSYGIKSDDGESFDKSEAILNKFKHSKAFEVFFMQLISDPDFAIKWIQGLLPAKYRDAISKEEMENKIKELSK